MYEHYFIAQTNNKKFYAYEEIFFPCLSVPLEDLSSFPSNCTGSIKKELSLPDVCTIVLRRRKGPSSIFYMHHLTIHPTSSNEHLRLLLFYCFGLKMQFSSNYPYSERSHGVQKRDCDEQHPGRSQCYAHTNFLYIKG